MFSRIKRTILKLGRVKQKVFCLFQRHKWRYYHRRCRLPALVSRETHYGIFPRRVCVHCGKRETVAEQEPSTITGATWTRLPSGLRVPAKPDPYVPPEAVSNESGAPPYVPGGLPDYDGVARKTQES